MNEREKLENAITALETQRGILGDAVVETALLPLRKRLKELLNQGVPGEQKRKQVTILFADVSGFTAMSEHMDVEDITSVMNALWARLDNAITTNGGGIDKHIGDAVMALWGAEQAREDDPERAIRAALAMQQELKELRHPSLAGRSVKLAMRIGLSTGPVLLGEVGSTREFTAMGDTVNLASRLEHAAPVGGILISHDTYRHVRGIFDVTPQAPLTVKGKSEPIQTYVIQGLKPRAFRVNTRGVEGIETRMIGRESELKRLQETYLAALEDRELQMVTIAAAAGVGKSRLLYEFQNWSELRPETVPVFKGRASPEMQRIPYALLRDVISFRFLIQDSDSPAAVREKMEKGVAWAYGKTADEPASTDLRMRAHFIGHLLGYDFSSSPYLKDILSDAGQIRDRALAYLADCFKALGSRDPLTIVLLEDFHWADDSSLDAILTVATACKKEPILILAAARHELFERRPQWGEGRTFHTRIDLVPLSRRESRVLVDEILQKVEAIPDALREMIVSNAEGNPFYVEELIKMLIEDGVVIRGEEVWQINPARLAEVRVPPTLTAVLQARFDTLPATEKGTLQRASVFGRIFWAEAVDYIAEQPHLEKTQQSLTVLRNREMIHWRETSIFRSTSEYIFRHSLMRSAIYESVLKHERRNYHARAANWLIETGGAEKGVFVGIVADHLERAGQAEKAINYLRQAAEQALATSAFGEALDFLRRALSLPGLDPRQRVPLLIQMGEALRWLGQYAEARSHLEEALALAEKGDDDGSCATALAHLGASASDQGDRTLARTHLERSLSLARKMDDHSRVARVQWELGWLEFREGTLDKAWRRLSESRNLCHARGDRQGKARALNGLGNAANGMGDFSRARSLFEESKGLFREVGDRRGESAALNNLGETARLQGDFEAARVYYEEGLAIDKEIGSQLGVAISLGNLGHAALAAADYPAAKSYYRESIQTAVEIGAVPVILESLAGLAGVYARQGQTETALEWLGLTGNHPALQSDARAIVDQFVSSLRERYSPEIVEEGLHRGLSLGFEAVIQSILQNDAGMEPPAKSGSGTAKPGG